MNLLKLLKKRPVNGKMPMVSLADVCAELGRTTRRVDMMAQALAELQDEVRRLKEGHDAQD